MDSATPGDCEREEPGIGTSSSWDGEGDFPVGGTEDGYLEYTQSPNDTKDTEKLQLSSIQSDSKPDDTKSEDSYPDSLLHDSNTSQDGDAELGFQPDPGSVLNIQTSLNSDLERESLADNLTTCHAVAAMDEPGRETAFPLARNEFDTSPESEATVALAGAHSVSTENMTPDCQQQFQEDVQRDVDHGDHDINPQGEGEISYTDELSAADHPGKGVKYKDDSNTHGMSPEVGVADQSLWCKRV